MKGFQKNKYIKLFESFIDYSFFDNQEFKGKKLYRGISNGELDYYNNNDELGNFFTSDKGFAEDYSDLIAECILLTNNVFNSHDPRNLQDVYDNDFKLYDSHSDTTFETLEEFIKGPMSDMWDVIENTEGLLDWIMSEYDVCYMSEGGYSTFYINNPNMYKVINIQ